LGSIGPWELALILFIALVVFGPGKLPELAKGLGKAVNEFKQASTGVQKEFREAMTEEPPRPVNVAASEKVTVEQSPIH